MSDPHSKPPGSELQRVRGLVADLDGIVWEADAATFAFTFVSEGAGEILGYPPADWLADTDFWADRIHPDDRARVLDRFTRVATEGGGFDEEYRVRAADGTDVWLRDIGHAVLDTAGHPQLIRGLMVEIGSRKAAEASAKDSEARFERVVAHLPAIVYLEAAAPDDELVGHMVYVSPQVEQILGFTPAEWTVDPSAWARQVHPDDRARVRREYERIEQSGGDFHAGYRMYTRGGDIRWMREEASLVRDADGTALYRQGIMFDVTNERENEQRARASDARYGSLVEQLPAIVYSENVTGEGLGLIFINERVEHLLGIGRDEWLADPGVWLASIHPDDRDRVRAENERVEATGEPFEVEYRMISRDGRVLWFADRAVVVFDAAGEPAFWQGVMLDITDREQAREESERLRAEDEMKSTFLQAISHDLRTPLAAILGLAVTLGREDLELPVDETRDLARRIAQNARRLDTLVADFLDLERLQRGAARPTFVPVDLGAIVRELVANSDLVAGRRLALEVAPLSVHADAAMIERMVENLIANAVKHTPGDSRIWVRVERTDGGALLIVEDDGPGVAPADREAIFDAYRQGPGAAAGSGVGLALVARFAELHGGRAWVQARVGGGASFRVLLAWDPGEEVAERPEDQPTDTGSSAESQA